MGENAQPGYVVAAAGLKGGRWVAVKAFCVYFGVDAPLADLVTKGRPAAMRCFAWKRKDDYGCDKLAGWTGLEPATSDVTGRRSNQLNYHPEEHPSAVWWAVQGSNLRPPACKTSALPLS